MTGFQNRAPKSKKGVSRVSISDCRGHLEIKSWEVERSEKEVEYDAEVEFLNFNSCSPPAHLLLTSPTSHSLHFWLSGGTFYTWVTKNPLGSGLYAPWRGAYRSGIFVMVNICCTPPASPPRPVEIYWLHNQGWNAQRPLFLEWTRL